MKIFIYQLWAEMMTDGITDTYVFNNLPYFSMCVGNMLRMFGAL